MNKKSLDFLLDQIRQLLIENQEKRQIENPNILEWARQLAELYFLQSWINVEISALEKQFETLGKKRPTRHRRPYLQKPGQDILVLFEPGKLYTRDEIVKTAQTRYKDTYSRGAVLSSIYRLEKKGLVIQELPNLYGRKVK